MTDKVHSRFRSFEDLVARTCERLFPGIGRYDRPIYGRVQAVNQKPGMVTAGLKLWSCDIQPLTLDLKPDKSRPILKDVPLDPIQVNSSGQAMFPKPFQGMVVRVAWMEGSRAHPFIQSFTAEGMSVPFSQMGELTDLLYQAVNLLQNSMTGASGPTFYPPPILAQIQLLLQRIPR